MYLKVKTVKYIDRNNSLCQDLYFACPQFKIISIYNSYFTGSQLWEFWKVEMEKLRPPKTSALRSRSTSAGQLTGTLWSQWQGYPISGEHLFGDTWAIEPGQEWEASGFMLSAKLKDWWEIGWWLGKRWTLGYLGILMHWMMIFSFFSWFLSSSFYLETISPAKQITSPIQ